ncbi:hypothetical protein [Pyrococcus sp. NA2]|uniref:hypothetical protein n=1 Tax=Pyrococcus sp. (strain NA2) TaxID=342949 RepID=UPI00064E1559|nr:hypothetical protein [Pyrococcus sp. NA2]
MKYETLKKREAIISSILFIGYSRLFEGISLENIQIGVAMTLAISIIPGLVILQEVKRGRALRGFLLASLVEFIWAPLFKVLSIRYWWHFIVAGILGLITVLWIRFKYNSSTQLAAF